MVKPTHIELAKYELELPHILTTPEKYMLYITWHDMMSSQSDLAAKHTGTRVRALGSNPTSAILWYVPLKIIPPLFLEYLREHYEMQRSSSIHIQRI